ncbi:tetratricopeptide repeat protein [Streptomyces sp. NPDC088812]|uniref:tetratricopeptide repeat protein n=1 Tax=Streptomyces sp. NPDC088812 TaxID=3365905 RepID=UPI00380B2C70
MSRLSREKKREQQHAGRQAAVVAPLDVHVSGGGPATIGGVPVVPADGQEIQHAVLGHLHRIALATGHPVAATVHDERIGYVVPLRVEPDGSSHFAGEPLRVAPPPQEPPAPSRHDKPTHALRSVPEPVNETAPTFPLRTVPEPRTRPQIPPQSQPHPQSLPHPHPHPHPQPEPQSQSQPRSLPQAQPHDDVPAAPGTVVAPTGVFGPPPAMNTPPPADTGGSAPGAGPEPDAGPVFGHTLGSRPDSDPDPKPTPARGFDAVAEAVLGDDPRSLPGDGGAPALLAEPMAQINAAVRAGRTQVAAALAERTVAQASETLGPEHPEVLRLRELGAYIAYLSADPLRSFHVSLDLARIHHRTRHTEAAYGNVLSAATAWRAVRDPLQGLNLGTELLALWTELTTGEGPAAEDMEELESARARMTRLAERARNSGSLPRG